jgi:hypothetical protein
MDLMRRLGYDVINLSSHGDVLSGKTRELARAATPPRKAAAVVALSRQCLGTPFHPARWSVARATVERTVKAP